MVRIDGERLLGDLHELRTFGACGTGVVRPTFSDADMAARRWLRQRMADAGLDASIDGVGNVVGRSPNPGPALVIGSHSDTQPEGGWLDGALGVIYGLEIARALLEDPTTSDLAIDAVAWSDEEGTYTSCLGASSFVGGLDDVMLSHTNADGETVAQAIERVGLADVEHWQHDPQRHIGYLEAHIEQGPFLEANDQRIGVVTSIVGIRALDVHAIGEQNHAGTTPMNRRRDAGKALFEFAVRVDEAIAEVAGPTSVWTIGNMRLEPGAESIIPGKAWLGLQFRDPHDEHLVAIEQAVVALAEQMTSDGDIEITASERRSPIRPTQMDESMRIALGAAAEANTSGCWTEMPSAAGHDPMVMVPTIPCAMLFIPSIGGISHDFAEDSHTDDIVLGAQVLADAATDLLRS